MELIHTYEELKEDGFIIASFGIKGAEILADVSLELKKTTSTPVYVWLIGDFQFNSKPLKTYTGITRNGHVGYISANREAGQHSQLYINGHLSLMIFSPRL